jgi:hypothetical protein
MLRYIGIIPPGLQYSSLAIFGFGTECLLESSTMKFKYTGQAITPLDSID